jgi:hypothetical protein
MPDTNITDSANTIELARKAGESAAKYFIENDPQSIDWPIIILGAINILVLGVQIYVMSKNSNDSSQAATRATIEAVKIAQQLQEEKSKADRDYQNKFNVFISVFAERKELGSGFHFVNNLNAIPVVFYNNTKVRDLYDKFIASHSNQQVDHSVVTHDLLLDMLKEMAADLGYPDLRQNATLRDAFLPRLLQDKYIYEDMYRKLYIRDNYHSYWEYMESDHGKNGTGPPPPPPSHPNSAG